MKPKILDISRPLGPHTPAYPGDTAFSISWPAPHGAGAAAVSAIVLSPHLGTHVDAPLHLTAGGLDAASLPLHIFVGPCTVIDLAPGVEFADTATLPTLLRPSTERVLLRTRAWPPGSPLPTRHPAPTPALIDHLADHGVMLIGVDTPSVDAPGDHTLPVHRRCLARGVAVLEGLDLSTAAPGRYTLLAAPLRLEGVEASPVRALLLPSGACF